MFTGRTYFSSCAFESIMLFLLFAVQAQYFFFFFNDTATTEIYTLSLHDALPIFIHQVPQESFYLLPSHYQMMTIEQDLSGPKVYNRERRLANLLEEMAEAFDWIIIDCPPNLGLLTDNAIIASRRLIVPVQAEQTSVRALELLLDQIESLERELKFTVDILTLVPNLVQDSKLARRILGGMRQNLPITDFAFPKRVILQEAYEAGRTIFTYEPDRSKREDASELQGLFMQLAQLVRER